MNPELLGVRVEGSEGIQQPIGSVWSLPVKPVTPTAYPKSETLIRTPYMMFSVFP